MTDDARAGLNRPSGSSRVLLVDDHSLFLEGLRNLLVAEGINVVGLAHDGFEALEKARRLRPDVILMDVQMPKCDGLTATRLIKAEMPECRIVMLTMSDDDEDLFEAVKSGASGYLLKQLDAAGFFKYLAELETGHVPFSPGLAERVLREFSRQVGETERPPAPHSRPSARPDGGPADAPPPSRAAVGALSPRQVQILTLVAQGHTYRQVGETIGIAERTVKYHMAQILETLHLENRAQVIAYAARAGLIRNDS